MKVLHLISGGDTGGAKTHVFALLDALSKMTDVKIACLIPGVFYQQIKERAVKSVLVEQKNRFDLSVVDKLVDIIQKEGFSILHAHGARANFVAKYLKKRIKIPVVTTVHSDYRMDFDGFYRKIVYTGLNVRALKKMDYYIGVSSNFRDMLIDRGFRPNRVFTVYNGMDYSTEPTYMGKEEFAKHIGISYEADKTYIGLIGRHDRVKGHDIFIRAAGLAAEKNPNLRFIIAGDGDGRDALVRLAAEVGIQDKLYFAGFVENIYSFINFIDINTLSSRSESFPYVLLEGARLKKPTISAAVGGIPDLIEDGGTGLLFPAEDYTAFAEKMLAMAEDEPWRTKMGEALYEKATTHFSNTSLAKSHMEIYRAILRDYHDTKKYDVVLSGYYGFHNSGDDALLLAILESLRAKMPDIRALVLSATPKETMRIYKTDAIPRFNVHYVARAFKNAHLLLFGGGSLLQDVTSEKSLWYYLYIMRLARKKGAGVYVYANGIGPLHNKNRNRVARAIEKCDMITLRDRISSDALMDMGVSCPTPEVTADPALALEGISREAAKQRLTEAGVPQGGRYFGIALRAWQGDESVYLKSIAKTIDYAAKTYGLTPVFIPMKRMTDGKVAVALAECMETPLYIIKEDYKVEEVVGIVHACDLVLGMRLHTLVYAVGGGVPVIGISYDPKVQGFMEYIENPYVVDMENIEAEKLCSYVDEIYKAYDKVQEILQEKANALKNKAEDNADKAIALLKNRQ